MDSFRRNVVGIITVIFGKGLGDRVDRWFARLIASLAKLNFSIFAPNDKLKGFETLLPEIKND